MRRRSSPNPLLPRTNLEGVALFPAECQLSAKTLADDLPVSKRTRNSLFRHGFYLVEDILGMTDADVVSMKQFGAIQLDEIRRALFPDEAP